MEPTIYNLGSENNMFNFHTILVVFKPEYVSNLASDTTLPLSDFSIVPFLLHEHNTRVTCDKSI